MRMANRKMKKSAFDSAVVAAINHTLGVAKTAANKEIRNEYKIRAKDIRPALSIRRAKRGKNTWEIEGALVATGRPLGLIRFGARQTKKGVSVNVLGQRKVVAKAFIATMKSGHSGVFGRGNYNSNRFNFRYKRIRKRGNDTPITEMKTVSIPTAFSNDVVLKHLANKMATHFPKRLAHEIGRRVTT